jgi:hypothetical protein
MRKDNILPLTIAAGAMFLSWLILRKDKQQTPTNNEDTDMRTNTMLPRGYRNNNPLNIRINADNDWQGKVYFNTDHVFEQFAFIGEQTTLPEAQAAFDRRDKKRMAALFVTRGGGKDGALLGMITPWDVLRKK